MYSGDLDIDCDVLLNKLKRMKLFTVNNRKTLNNNIRPISCVFGYTKFKNNGGYSEYKKKPSEFPGWYETKLKTQYPELNEYFKFFSVLYMGDFKFNQVVINKNFKIGRHKDKKNVGESYIIGLGDYTGGELVIEDNEKEKKIIDIKNNPYTFNGSEKYHYVLPFEGERFSLVFYSNDLI